MLVRDALAFVLNEERYDIVACHPLLDFLNHGVGDGESFVLERSAQTLHGLVEDTRQLLSNLMQRRFALDLACYHLVHTHDEHAAL